MRSARGKARAAEQAHRRVEQVGERPVRVHVAGSITRGVRCCQSATASSLLLLASLLVQGCQLSAIMSEQRPSGTSNRLINENSPYLLQHAHNPVDWYPWGAEAFAKAKREEKPLFLSFGYSTCHWCHVMERESFEDPDIAQLMNQWFVSIKVDREERPDIDNIYMTVVVAMIGQGGWP